MRWMLVIAALLLAGCPDGRKPSPPPVQPVLALIHGDPLTFVGGGSLPGIERRELRCRQRNVTLAMPLPESGQLPISQLLAGMPEASGRLDCFSVVYVDGVESLHSNLVGIHCDPPTVANRRCWER